MLEFFETAKTDFLATFEGAWIFPILLAAIIWILIKGKRLDQKNSFWNTSVGFFVPVLVPVVGAFVYQIVGG